MVATACAAPVDEALRIALSGVKSSASPPLLESAAPSPANAQMRRVRSNPLPRAWLAASVSLALAACSEATAPPAAAALPATTADLVTTRTREGGIEDASPPAGLDGGAVRAFLVAQYGDLAQLAGDWPGVPHGERLGVAAASREVCAREAVGTTDAPAELVAVCGVPDDAGHAISALVDFFLLRQNGDLLDSVARAHMDTFGSNGDVVDVTVRRFGPGLHGFIVEDGFTGQGITITSSSIVLPRDGGFHEAATLRSSLDNAGAMESCAMRGDCPPDGAYDLRFDFDIDARDTTATAWPLRVRERGEACGQRVDRTHLVPFDVAAGVWTVPAELQRTSCD